MTKEEITIAVLVFAMIVYAVVIGAQALWSCIKKN